ncbi:hypothetical protein PAXRUDRAFT_833728 [Paxillus rubicundulus Ve08.2h10]|uniref:Uncharacterized protein n=1 Tax=Paxillus rubicundulus Ve08.2h10 TaxID=930991 RepID=A0A0D0D8M4_9AGAM|nr:hypothetical protein PAXRUDRAFT_833728 [Paxillus rubicundulus Ve08.2h10]
MMLQPALITPFCHCSALPLCPTVNTGLNSDKGATHKLKLRSALLLQRLQDSSRGTHDLNNIQFLPPYFEVLV